VSTKAYFFSVGKGWQANIGPLQTNIGCQSKGRELGGGNTRRNRKTHERFLNLDLEGVSFGMATSAINENAFVELVVGIVQRKNGEVVLSMYCDELYVLNNKYKHLTQGGFEMVVSHYSVFLVPFVPFLCSIGSMFHVVASPITLYHYSSPIPNTLYRCIRFICQESAWSGRSGFSLRKCPETIELI